MLNPAAALQWTGPFRIEHVRIIHVRENRRIIDQGSGVHVSSLSDLPLTDVLRTIPLKTSGLSAEIRARR